MKKMAKELYQDSTSIGLQLLYDSDRFVVTHQAHPDSLLPNSNPIFEIVDKQTNKELVLCGAWASAFRRQIEMWQLNTPSQEEVEEMLTSYADLAQLPLVVH
jgi:hypothetical protein